MAIYQLKTFLDCVNSIREELGIQSTDINAIAKLKRDINIVYAEIIAEHNWTWLQGNTSSQLKAFLSNGTASVTQGSATVTLSIATGEDKTGQYFVVDGYSEIYKIDSHVPGSATLLLNSTFTGATNPTASFRVWTDQIILPTDCKETVSVWHDFNSQPLIGLGQQEFRRASTGMPRAEGRPGYYYTGNFVDPTRVNGAVLVPAASSRSSVGVMKKIILSTSLPASVVVGTRLRISSAGHPSYNGDVILSSITTTNITNDTIQYVGKESLTEANTTDSAAIIKVLSGDSAVSRYRALTVYPALTSANITLHIDYIKDASALDADSDEPIIPLQDRNVLLYGALHRAWSRERNPEEAARNLSLYQNKLAKMAGKLQDTFDKPKLQPSKLYLGAKRTTSRGVRLGGYPSGGDSTGGGGGGAGVATGKPSTVAVFNARGELEGSSTTSLNDITNIAGLTSNAQTQLNATKVLATGSIEVGNVSGVRTAVIPSGDVTIDTTGNVQIVPGIIINSDINAAAAISLSKLASVTPSKALVSDAGGAVSASSVSATELGYVSGVTSAIQNQINTNSTNIASNTTAIAGKQPTGNYLTGLTGDVTATGPGSVAATVASVGGSSASAVNSSVAATTAATNLNTASTLVKRDISGNFSAGTISAALTGNVTGNLTGNASGSAASITGNLTGDVTSVGMATSITALPVSKLAAGTNGQVLTVTGGVPAWGAAGGAGGVNYVGLDSTWTATQLNDRNADSSVGNWTAYNDGATSLPVDLTGGVASGNVTLARTTTAGEVLNGAASFKITKGAFNVIGEGFSVPFYIPLAYRNTGVTISIPFKVISGSIVQGDLKVYVYDVTNSQLITPYALDIVGNQGILTATFQPNSTMAQGRLAIHFASSAATALSLSFDDVSVSPGVATYGLAGSNTNSYSLAITATTTSPTSTPTVNNASWTRVGEKSLIRFDFNSSSGTAGSGVYLFSLPPGQVIDTTKQVVDTSGVTSNVGYASGSRGGTKYAGYVFAYDSTHFGIVMGSSTLAMTAAGPAFTLDVQQSFSFEAIVPIVGWDANVSMAASSTYKISSFLANGTRLVGSAPTALGQYRSYLRSGTSVNTLTETSAAPTTVPTAADGFRIYGIAFNSAGTSGNPGRYEVFVGKNKNVRFDFFSGAGRTGYVGTNYALNGTSLYGVVTSYDPTTGIAVLDAVGSLGTDTTRYVGLALGAGTAAPASATDCYADITVSENALAVGVQAPRSEIYVYGPTQATSSTAAVIYGTTVTNTGTAITKTSTAADGDLFTINEDGIYTLDGAGFLTNGRTFGFVKNAASPLTGDVQSVANASRLAHVVWNTSEVTPGTLSLSRTVNLKAGDVIRVMQRSLVNPTDNSNYFSIVKVSN